MELGLELRCEIMLGSRFGDAVPNFTERVVMASTKSIGRTLAQKITRKIQGTAHMASTARTVAKVVAQNTVQSATATAKEQLDQVLLNLQHSKLSSARAFSANLRQIKDPQDVLHRVGIGVLERAEAIRQQITKVPFTPDWLKDLSLTVPKSWQTETETKTKEESQHDSETASNPAIAVSAGVDDLSDVSPPDSSHALGATPDATPDGTEAAVVGSAMVADTISSFAEASVSAPAEEMQPELFSEASDSAGKVSSGEVVSARQASLELAREEANVHPPKQAGERKNRSRSKAKSGKGAKAKSSKSHGKASEVSR